MKNSIDTQKIIEQFCLREDLSTYDPYDIWKTPFGFHIKNLFNHNSYTGFLPAGILTLFDTFVNNRFRIFYSQQEYPIVRAFAALSLLNLYCKSGQEKHIDFVKKHLRWLVNHSCRGYSGYCWGLSFNYAVSSRFTYGKNTPLSTVTPYVLEAFAKYSQVTQDTQFNDIIGSIYDFFEKDIVTIEESDKHLITSYGPMRDRIVINAVSYAMYSYSLLLPYVPLQKKEYVKDKIRKLYAYIHENQRDNGSWLYSPLGKSFIDCFHSCIVLKNIVKTDKMVQLNDCAKIVKKGYDCIKENLLDNHFWLFRRFALKNKPSLVRFDLYDNAEMINLGMLLGDNLLVGKLSDSINRYFCCGRDIYSQIDILGIRRNKNMLRWAVMPYVYALSERIGLK